MKLLLLLTIFSSCSFMVAKRSYVEEMDGQVGAFFNPGVDFEVTAGDWGPVAPLNDSFMRRIPSLSKERQNYNNKQELLLELQNKELVLTGQDRMKYQLIKTSLNTTSEKIYYLNLDKISQQNFLSSKNLNNIKINDEPSSFFERKVITDSYKRGIASTINERPVTLGMKKNEVLHDLGGPIKREVAGHPSEQNERWIYVKNGKTRYIYFENGLVRGWEYNNK